MTKGYVTCPHGNSYDPDRFRCIKCNPSPHNPEEEMVMETASFEACTRCNCVLFDNEKSLGVCIICRDLDATYLNDDCTLSNKSCPKYYGKYENGKWTGNKLCTCVEGRCWYDEQKARRKDGLKAIAPESWDGGSPNPLQYAPESLQKRVSELEQELLRIKEEHRSGRRYRKGSRVS